MFLTTTFTKNEFVTLFDSEPALPPPPPSSLVVEFGNEVLKSISKLDVFRVFERVCDTPGVYVRFHDRVESVVFFTSPVLDAHTIYDLLQHVRGVYGAFFLFASVNHPLCFHRDDLPTAADYNSLAADSNDDQEWIDKIDDAVSFAECSSWKQYKYVFVSRRHRDAVTAVVTGNCCLLMMMDDDRGGYTDRLLVPFVHYVPLAADGRDLVTTLSWLRDNERAVSVIVDNARQHCRRHMTRVALAEATGKIMSARNYVLRPCRYRRTRPFPEFNFTLDWCGRRDFDSSHDLRLDELTANERHAAFVQTMVMMQFLQWHYCAYLSSFRLFFRRPTTDTSNTTATTTFVLRELYDHHFVDAPCSVYIRLDGLVYYVDADGLTNYADHREIKHNYRDVVSYFKYDDHDSGDTFARAFARFHERHAARASSYYQRRYPTPILKLDRSVRTSNYPLPFDHNTNKLVIYRQYQIYQATLNDVYRRAFRAMLSRKRVERVTFNLMDTTAYDVARLKYGDDALPRLPDANDTVHVRTIYEVMTVVSRVDRPHYVRMFKPMTDVDKVLYSISYAQLKTIIEFCEQ